MTSSQDETRTRLVAEVAKRVAPTRAQWRRHQFRVLAVGGAWWLALTLAWSRSPLPGSSAWMATATAWFLLMVIVSGHGTIGGGSSALGRSRMHLSLAALGTMLLALGVAGIAALVPEESPLDSHSSTIACLKATVVMALGPFIAILAVKRGSDYVRPRATGMIIGTLSGALGGV